VSTRKEEREKIALLQGTLDLLILRTLVFGPEHGQGIALFGVSAVSVSSFVVVPVVFAILAVLSVYLPARRAMRVDPLVALRYE
jgi:ABC-type lipoprotein release transport system permease subunit